MAESPERKAFKKVLVKLKAKSLASENSVEDSWKDIANFSSLLANYLQKMVEEYPQDDTMKGFQNTILMNTLMVGLHQKEAKAAIEDLKLYIEALEEAYKQLDKNFEKAIFEPAKKQAEIMIKEQKELGRRTKPKFYS